MGAQIYFPTTLSSADKAQVLSDEKRNAANKMKIILDIGFTRKENEGLLLGDGHFSSNEYTRKVCVANALLDGLTFLAGDRSTIWGLSDFIIQDFRDDALNLAIYFWRAK